MPIDSGKFVLKTPMKPAGDQPTAIASINKRLERGDRHTTLLGATGTGKTFTMANVIAKIQKPTLVIAHNKTLAAQLAQEFRDLFPDNAVSYFVSYYDFYQPEAYVVSSDTYIEKEAMINEEIERLRHAATQSLLTRRDSIVVASVSCIYGLGSPAEYEKVNFRVAVGDAMPRGELVRSLIRVHYERTTADLKPGMVRGIGPAVEVMPISERFVIRVTFEGDRVASMTKIDGVTRAEISPLDYFYFFPAKHFITEKDQIESALKTIEHELKERLAELEKEGKILEAERLKRRTRYDLAMIREVGYTNGIENYSRHFSGKKPGEAPDTLLSYFPRKKDGTADFLTVIDESHVTVPQIGGMYAGDKSRKDNLVEYGFRLPSCRDNRPLKFEEFEKRIGQTVYVSATPGKYELEKAQGDVVEQIIRPTGLVDPAVEVRPVTGKGDVYPGQVPNFIKTAEEAIAKGGRVLATTLTKKMAEDMSAFLETKGVRAKYLHSDVKTIERIEILTDLRKGNFDILVGVNLLREGLDLPEVTLIGILDADKEGFLRSDTSLIQTIGRAARNVDGKVILYADVMTGSLERAIGETSRRRAVQVAYNEKHGITPTTIVKAIKSIAETMRSEHDKVVATELNAAFGGKKATPSALRKILKIKEKEMNSAAKMLDFETAAIIRDEIAQIEQMIENEPLSDAAGEMTHKEAIAVLKKEERAPKPMAGTLAKGRGWAAARHANAERAKTKKLAEAKKKAGK
ncbi:MAG TPA: excinuclease ABC subunit UvrB [Candidatus Paceibacterota bacterium]